MKQKPKYYRHLVEKLIDIQAVWRTRRSDVMHDICGKTFKITECLEYGFEEGTV